MPNNAGMENTSPIERAISEAGGLTKLAHMLGVTAPTVHEWKTLKRPVPASRCNAIVQLANGKVTLQELRPDDWRDYWPEPTQATVNTAQAATANVEQGG